MSATRRMFHFLLLLYPPRYREQFGREMAELFELRAMASRSQAEFVISEMAGLIAGAAREWLARRTETPWARTPDLDSPHFPNQVIRARQRVDDAVQRMVYAISHHQFEQARKLAIEERIERENLRRVCDDYGIDAI